MLLLKRIPLLFDRLERRTLGRGANEGTAKRDLRATKRDPVWISFGYHYSFRTLRSRTTCGGGMQIP